MQRILHRFVGFYLIATLQGGAFAQSTKKTDIIEVPFEFYRNSVILQVKVDGKGPYDMLLDTGTDPSAIDLDTAKELALKINPIDVGGTGAGSDKIVSYETVLSDVQVGNLIAKNVAALAGESLSKISQKLGRTIKGVLGYSFLDQRIVQFNFPKKTIRFYATSPALEGSGATERRTMLHFQLSDATPVIDEVYVNGRKITATLDTGSNGSLRLTWTAIKNLGLEEEARRSAVVSATGYGGKAQYREGQLQSVAIGSLVVDHPTARFVMEKRDGEEGRPEGNIGNALLSNFSVTFDYVKKLVIFERN